MYVRSICILGMYVRNICILGNLYIRESKEPSDCWVPLELIIKDNFSVLVLFAFLTSNLVD